MLVARGGGGPAPEEIRERIGDTMTRHPMLRALPWIAPAVLLLPLTAGVPGLPQVPLPESPQHSPQGLSRESAPASPPLAPPAGMHGIAEADRLGGDEIETAYSIPCPTDPPIPSTVCDTLQGCSASATPASLQFEGCIPYNSGLPPPNDTEQFWFQIPIQAPGPIPCLVVLHGFGNGHCSVRCQTDFDVEADLRGWAVLAPRGGPSTSAWGHPMSQRAVIAALDRLDTFLQDPALATTYGYQTATIDRSRVWIVGWSMGGGWALSMAERHLDPTGWRFAAAAVDAGALDLIDVYQSDPGSQANFVQVFSVTPTQDPFPYQQVSAIHLADPTQSMFSNLLPIPVFSTYSTCDKTGVACADAQLCFASGCPPGLSQCQGYLPPQASGFTQAFLQAGGVEALQIQTTATCDDAENNCFFGFGGDDHSWCLMDETLVCDWLQQFSFPAQPGPMTITSDRVARFYGIDTEPAAPPPGSQGVFGHADVAVSGTTLSLISIDQMAVLTARLDDPSIGLDPTQGFAAGVQIADGGGLQLGFDSPCQGAQKSFPLVGTLQRDGTLLAGTWNPFPTRLETAIAPGDTQLHTYTYRPNDPQDTLAATGLPLFGQSMTIDVHAGGAFAASPFMLLVGIQPLQPALPFGTGALGATSIQVAPAAFASGTLDAFGDGSVPIPIPQVQFPSLVKGLFVHFQALVLGLPSGPLEATQPLTFAYSDVDPCP